jgi:GDPmannose 4,6-dehydratase
MTIEPDEIYNLAGQSSVGLSFNQPGEALESIASATMNILEVLRIINRPIRFYSASSSECFGDIGDNRATEETAFTPCSPYGVAKAAAHWQVSVYRKAYDLFACSGICFNHESPLRSERFVTQKIIVGAVRTAKIDSAFRLQLGDLSIHRDWGWAPDYVDAMWRMLQADEPDDYVIATGETHSLEEFLAAAYNYFDLDWHDHVDTNPELYRLSEIKRNTGNASKALQHLGWEAHHKMEDVVKMMLEAELAKIQ